MGGMSIRTQIRDYAVKLVIQKLTVAVYLTMQWQVLNKTRFQEQNFLK